jgi:hypothetical protein
MPDALGVTDSRLFAALDFARAKPGLQTSLKVDHPHDHGAARVEGQIL